MLPPEATHVDSEAELAVEIGRRCRRVSEDDALDVVAGYRCANDVSARNLQYGDKQWTRGKGFDTFCPVGDELVPVSRARRRRRPAHRAAAERRALPGRQHVRPAVRRPLPGRVRVERLHARAGRPDPDGHAVGHRPHAQPAGVDAGRRRGRDRDRADRRAAEPRRRPSASRIASASRFLRSSSAWPRSASARSFSRVLLHPLQALAISLRQLPLLRHRHLLRASLRCS